MTFFNCSSAQADIFDTASTMNSRAFSLVTPTFFIHSCGVSNQTGLAGALVDVLSPACRDRPDDERTHTFLKLLGIFGKSVVSLPTCEINDGTTDATNPPTSSSAIMNTRMIEFWRLKPRFF